MKAKQFLLAALLFAMSAPFYGQKSTSIEVGLNITRSLYSISHGYEIGLNIDKLHVDAIYSPGTSSIEPDNYWEYWGGSIIINAGYNFNVGNVVLTPKAGIDFLFSYEKVNSPGWNGGWNGVNDYTDIYWSEYDLYSTLSKLAFNIGIDAKFKLSESIFMKVGSSIKSPFSLGLVFNL